MRPYAALALLLLAGCSGEPPAAPSDAPGPAVAFDPVNQDLGRVDSELERDVVFGVRNEGASELRIERVDTTCGCAKPRFPKSLAPGESGQIVVRFAPEPVASGPTTQSVKVHTSARFEPYELTFTADQQALLRLAPGTPLVMPVEPGGVATQIIALTPRAGSGARVEAFDCTDPRAKLEFVEERAGSLAYRLTVRSPGTGDFTVPLAIRGSHPRLAGVEYVVSVQASTGPVATPSVLKVPALSHEAIGTFFPVVVVTARDRDVDVLSAKVEDPALEVLGVDKGEVGTSVRVGYRGGWPAGDTRRTRLLIVTDHPDTPELSVPIEVRVLEAGEEERTGSRR